jgi:hypothetical protein
MLYFVDGEVSLGIFGTTSKEAILSQLRPVINSGAIDQMTNLRDIHV